MSIKQTTIRKKNAEMVKRNMIKIFGGLNCGNYDTQKDRRECNHIIRKHVDISQRHVKCDIDNKIIKFKDLSILLEKLIGEGKYGQAYLSVLKYKNQTYHIIIKQQIVDKKSRELLVNKELQILQYLSLLVQNNVSPHFLHYYSEISCKVNSTSQQDSSLFNKYIKTFIVEKASGALSELKETLKTNFNSIISQIILSIYTFHQYTKCYHCDTHHNNFLYHELLQRRKTYIKYKLDDNIYKLKLSKYLIILWDYGLAKPMINTDVYSNSDLDLTYIIYDYYRIFNIIGNSKYYNINIDDKIMINKILSIFANYDEMISEAVSEMYNQDEIIEIILEFEKDMIYTLIEDKILFADVVYSRDYAYNGIPYDLENIGKYNIPVFL